MGAAAAGESGAATLPAHGRGWPWPGEGSTIGRGGDGCGWLPMGSATCDDGSGLDGGGGGGCWWLPTGSPTSVGVGCALETCVKLVGELISKAVAGAKPASPPP